VSEKKNNPLVSVIMNCFNGEFFLREAIESVINQTYENWELIFWDNRSKDKSAEIFKSYNDKRLKYFYANEHTPLYKARNLAIEKSKGDFISFIDTDDLWNKNKLELQIPYFIDPKVGVVYSNLWITKKKVTKRKLYVKKKLPSGNIFYNIIKNYNVGILSVVIRKNFFLSLKEKFDERFSMIGDFDLFLRLSKICIFKSIQIPLASVRLHGQNLTVLMKDKETEEMEIWLKENKCNLSGSYLEIIQKKVNYSKFLHFKIEGKYKECINILLNSKIGLFNIKNLFLFFTPVILLKKLMWFYNDFK